MPKSLLCASAHSRVQPLTADLSLCGARMEQLPEIWRRLVEAGFESGQAYGKAVRTVKSCTP